MNVMLSYRSSDSDFMMELAKHLRSQRIDPWIDREGIRPGEKWRDALINELKVCDKLIVILSRAYLKSEHCRMELFIARSFGKPILPIMVEDCFTELRSHEETKGLEDIFMMRLYNLSAVGLPISRDEALRRVSKAVINVEPNPQGLVSPLLYISYTTSDGEFATELSSEIERCGTRTWIATRNVAVGENWRDAQARAMMRATAHLVILDENLVRQNVLRTEILLSEARGLPTLPILPKRLNGEQGLISSILRDLDSADQTYRRLGSTQYFRCDDTLNDLAKGLINAATA